MKFKIEAKPFEFTALVHYPGGEFVSLPLTGAPHKRSALLEILEAKQVEHELLGKLVDCEIEGEDGAVLGHDESIRAIVESFPGAAEAIITAYLKAYNEGKAGN